MLRRTYLYENRMFTNKVKNSLIEGVGKEKNRVRASYYKSERIGLSDRKV
jgi:hypothetical protein